MAEKPSTSCFLPLKLRTLLLLCCSEAPPQHEFQSYARTTLDATLFPADATYDYVIVGGGTAGFPLAATLLESHRVLLLERGGSPNEFPSLETQDGFLRTLVEHNGTGTGSSTLDTSGRRHIATDLHGFTNPDNIRVALPATVDRLVFNSRPGSRRRRNQQAAIGVVYRDQFGRQHRAMIRPGGEVILSASAPGSPHLLLLSGIGSRR